MSPITLRRLRTTGEPGRGEGLRTSVVIPAHNAEGYLQEAIGSILAQTLMPAEVVVVDDGSTDATAAVAAAFGPPVRCVRRQREGIGAALNTGVEHSTGALLSFLDADDMWLPEKLALQTDALRSDPTLDYVLGHVVQFRSPELTADEAAGIAVPSELMPGISKGTLLIRRESFLCVGAFATQWRAGEFIEWYARAIDAGLKGTMLDRVVLRRRLHRSNMGVREKDARPEYVRVLRSVLDRRRASRA
jgi:glycosyltransferase involved in cell wall biosynthesis